MDTNYNINQSGYNPLRFDPNMVANQMAMYQGNNQNQSQNPYQMKKEWEFGLNYNHIAMSNAIQGIGAFIRGKNQVSDFKSYNRVQQNPLLQLPQNPNTSEQSQYGMNQFKRGGKKMAEGGMANFDDFDEDDFQDLKEQMDKYFSEKGTEQKPEIPDTDQEDKEEEKPKEEQSQDEPMSHSALNFLNTPQEDEPEETPKNDDNTGEPQQYINEPPISLSGRDTPDQSNDPLVQSFKRGIAKVENAGYNEGNKNSTAFGKYQFTAPTREAVREQFFKDINKKDFETAYKEDPKFQEKVMDVYGSHLLHQFNGNVHEAAIAHFLGPGKANLYNQPSYNPGHGNVSVGQYLNSFDKGYGQRKGGIIVNRPKGIDLPINPAMKMAEGGDPVLSGKSISKNIDPNLQKGYMVDDLNYTLTHGDIPRGGATNPLLMNAYLWSKRDDMKGKSPQDIISSYYSQPSQGDALGVQRAALGNLGHGAGAMYNNTPDVTVRDPNKIQYSSQPNNRLEPTIKFAEGGEYNLTNTQIAQLKKQGYEIEIIK